MVGHLSLSRDHHSTDLVASLREILEANSLVDCMISAEGQYLKAHKLILSACSPYFQSLFREETDKYPIVLLKDIEFEYLKLIINFVYCGEVQVLDTQLNSFLEVAKFLQIKGLNASSRECSPERTFSELPASTSMHGNESQANNEIIVDDDDCEVIDLAGATALEDHELPSAGSPERSLLITDESTFSLAAQGNRIAASQDFIRAANQEWHSRPVSPVSVASITSVKTEQLVDCEELNGHSRPCSENEGTECVETEQGAQVNGTPKCHNSSSSVNADVVKEIENIPLSERSNPAGKRANSSHSNATAKRKAPPAAKPMPPARKEGRSRASSPTPARESADASAPESTQQQEEEEEEEEDQENREEGEGRRPASAPPRSSERRARYTCAECNKSFEYRSWLKLHLRRHTGERPYSCPECTQTFALPQNLKLHMVTHSTRRPYKCPHCDQHFSLPARLKSHLKVHTGVKPFKCAECGYATAYSSDLSRHKRVHTGERPYKCPECDYAAVCSTHLISHRRTHERVRQMQEEQARFRAQAQAQAQAQATPSTSGGGGGGGASC